MRFFGINKISKDRQLVQFSPIAVNELYPFFLDKGRRDATGERFSGFIATQYHLYRVMEGHVKERDTFGLGEKTSERENELIPLTC